MLKEPTPRFTKLLTALTLGLLLTTGFSMVPVSTNEALAQTRLDQAVAAAAGRVAGRVASHAVAHAVAVDAVRFRSHRRCSALRRSFCPDRRAR